MVPLIRDTGTYGEATAWLRWGWLVARASVRERPQAVYGRRSGGSGKTRPAERLMQKNHRVAGLSKP